MAGQLKVGGNKILEHTGVEGAGVVQMLDQNGNVVLSDDGSGVSAELNSLSVDGPVVINESGADVDFRIESDTNENAFFLDGATGNIGIGTSSPARPFSVVATGTTTSVFERTDGTYVLSMKGNGTTSEGALGMDTNDMVALVNGAERMRIDSSGNVGIGDTAPDEKLVVNGKIRVVGSSFKIESYTTHSGNDAGIGVQVFGRYDIRDPVPQAHAVSGYCRFGFTSWNLNSVSPYADSFIMNSYSDSSGGSPNMLLVNKNGSGVKIARGGWNSNTNFKNGSIYTLNYTAASDERVKENVQNITGGLATILALRPVIYEWTDEYIREGHSKNANENQYTQAEGEAPVITIPETKTTNVGFIAQEVETVLPTVVHQDNIRLSSMEEGDYLKNVSYEKIVPHLVAAIKEQQAIIDDLKTRIETLEG